MDRKDDPNVVENATDARQGRTGMPVLIVLAAGLILAMVAWGWAEWWGEATDPPGEQQNTAVPQSGPEQAPSQAPAAGSGNTAPTDSTPHSQSGTGGPVPTTNPTGSTTKKP